MNIGKSRSSKIVLDDARPIGDSPGLSPSDRVGCCPTQTQYTLANVTLRMHFVTERHADLWRSVEAELPVADLAHNAAHVLRVYDWCVRLAPEAGVEVDLAGACALVHDLVNIPKDDADRPLGGERSAQAAPAFLAESGYQPAEIGEIVEAVRTSSWSRGLAPTSDLGRVLQDADRLDAIGAIGIARCVSTAQSMGSSYYHPSDPLAQTGRTLDDRAYAVDHFRRKLLLLADGMHLPTARQEASARHQTMLHWLDALQREVAPRPENLENIDHV